jgi:hypothetical protein
MMEAVLATNAADQRDNFILHPGLPQYRDHHTLYDEELGRPTNLAEFVDISR